MGQAFIKEYDENPEPWTPEMEKWLKEFMMWFEGAYEQV